MKEHTNKSTSITVGLMRCGDSTATPGGAQTFDNMISAESYAHDLREKWPGHRIVMIRTVVDAFVM